MCGIAGIISTGREQPVYREQLQCMVDVLHHRGPDSTSIYGEDFWGLGFKRLSIIDHSGGQQPFYSEDGNIILVCNGEIFNYKELRAELMAKGHRFQSHCDVEVIIPLYLEYGADLFHKLVGQFAFSLYDKKHNRLLLARDQFGICPLFYTQQQGYLAFASEIKAILQLPFVEKRVNLTALDQVLAFPGPVSPETMFAGIYSLKPGEYMLVEGEEVKRQIYWDADFPQEGDYDYGHGEEYYVEALAEKLLRSVRYRMVADVPLGFYLSGGLDSSLIGSLMRTVAPDAAFKSFSVTFPHTANAQIDERVYQRRMASYLQSKHHEINFDWQKISHRLRDAVYYGETAMKESYNTCSLALSARVRQEGIKVVLSGEGADELCGGYIGYRMDAIGNRPAEDDDPVALLFENQLRSQLWGDESFFYEKNHHEFSGIARDLYAGKVNENYDAFECLARLPVDKKMLAGRHPFHKRSYLDLKLRLGDHLIADHCDRMCFANSVEGRYPFLDVELFEFLKTVPPDIQLHNLVEKYLLKRVADKYLPEEIVARQKFGFVAPGSCQLLQNKDEMTLDLLSYDRIKRQGYFNPDTIERLKKIYSREGFKLNVPYDNDLLIVVLTFNMLLDVFDMPGYTN